MDIFEPILASLASLKTNKFRSILMLMGIVIGVTAVIIVVAVGQAGQKRIGKELETFGINTVWVWRDWQDRDEAKENVLTSHNEINNEDIKILEVQAEYLRNISPCYYNSGLAQAGRKAKILTLLGTTANFLISNNEEIEAGRFINEWDIAYQRKVVILSEKARNFFFEKVDNPLEETLRIKGEPFKVIGLLKKKDRSFLDSIGSAGGSAGDVYIPLSVAQSLDKTKNINYVQANAVGNAEAALGQMTETLNRRHGVKIKFAGESMQKYISVSNNIMGTLSLVLGIIAGISLLVGGLGIMNVMLISVTERTREIGLRKAVGATETDIIAQFLIEAIVISLVGGGIGIALGLVGVYIIQSLAGVQGILSWQPVAVAFGASLLAGVLAGIYPAYQAARLDPIYALRYE